VSYRQNSAALVITRSFKAPRQAFPTLTLAISHGASTRSVSRRRWTPQAECPRSTTAAEFWRRAATFFAAHDITVEAVVIDNGTPQSAPRTMSSTGSWSSTVPR